ncbi:hypothetical protein KTAU_14870 [Thermogemmatispora aurantia]|uniref:Uncharacterized protein n=1 Tax=Thermogemmatispora aurantia TaxID=2045279 RepID=A0A5J4K820_9CHLR|nr:hypothetical protein [Thermogemmatispora aurantia]GER82850.1 hypothetical protein KTAU_14870 [Thermogemmatispora aurantia]
MSTLRERQHQLASVNYSQLLATIGKQLQRLQQEKRLVGTEGAILQLGKHRLSFNIDHIAQAVASQVKELAHPFENSYGTSYASVYFAEDKARSKFSSDLEQYILQPLRQAFNDLCRLHRQTPEQCASSLFQALSRFSIKRFEKFDPRKPLETINNLRYPLGQPSLVRRRRLHFQKQPGTKERTRLKGHKLTIDVQRIDALRENIIAGIQAHLETYRENKQAEEDELKEAAAILRQTEGPVADQINTLCETITNEVLARIQRTARLHYLAYIRESLISDPKASQEELQAARLLQTLIERLRQLESYLQRHPDSHYLVSYGALPTQQRLNLRDLFSRADAFDPLPIFGEVAGQLGEIIYEQQGLKRFIHGLRLKLNGKVHVHGGEGEPSFSFHLALLQPGNPAFARRRQEAESNGTLEAFYTRIIRVAVLYFFAFKRWEDPTYQPEHDFEQELLPILRAGSQEEKEAALQRLAAELEPPEAQDQGSNKSTLALLQQLRTVLIASLTKPSHQARTYRTDLVVSLSTGVLARDPEKIFCHHHFFSPELSFQEERRRELLKYITIEGASLSSNVLCKLDVSLQIEPLYFLKGEEASEETIGSYQMSHDLGQLQALPVILVPAVADKQETVLMRGLIRRRFGDLRHIALGYGYHYKGQAVHSEAAFVYRFTYLLLAYLFIKLVVDSATAIEPDQRFIPLICIHVEKEEAGQEHYNDESVLHGITKVLEHLLGADYLTSSQGLHRKTLEASDQTSYHMLRSALCSLYAALPHRFKPQAASATTASNADPAQQGRLDKVAILVVSSRKCDYNTQARDDYLATIYGEVLGLERQGNDLVLRRLRTFADNHPSESMHTRPDIIIEQARYCAQQGYRHLLYVAHAPYSRTLGLTKGGARELFFMSQDIIQAMREVGADFRVYPIFCDLYYVLDLERSSAKQDQESLYIDELRELADVVNDPSKRTVMFLNLYTGYSIPAGAPEAQERVYNGVMAYSTVTHVYDQDPTYEQYIWSDLLAPDQPGTTKHSLIEAITLLHFMRFERPSNPMMKLDPYKRIIGDRSIGAQAIIPHMKGQCRFNMLAFLTHVRSVLRSRELEQARHTKRQQPAADQNPPAH